MDGNTSGQKQVSYESSPFTSPSTALCCMKACCYNSLYTFEWSGFVVPLTFQTIIKAVYKIDFPYLLIHSILEPPRA